ncbi:MAG: TonB-dependent receptor [Candidatus Kapabacteria bacterium]|nr:TonB-dependent receptor [Candidatus Kapabacteria bacterium]
MSASFSIPSLLSVVMLTAVVHAAGDDTVRVYRRDSAIVVTATSWLSDATGAGPARSVLSREVIDRIAPLSLSATMTLFPGVFVKDYGGIGGLQLVSLRGGSSAQALVLLDGARLSSAQSGTVDMTSIPMRYIDQAEVVRGGASALYGANAITGAVNVRLRLRDDARATALVSHGAFNEWRAAAGVMMPIADDVRCGVDVDVIGTRGSFPFTTSQFGTTFEVNRQNGDARHVRALARLESGDRHSATLLVRTADRGVPGAVVQGAITQARARIVDNDLMAIIRSTLVESPSDRVWLTASARFIDQHFADPDATIIGTQGIDVRYRQRDATLSTVWQHQSRNYLTTMRLDASHADLQGASVVSRNGEMVQRRSVSMSADATMPDVYQTGLEIRAAARADVFSDVGVAVSPMLALRRSVLAGLSLRAGWSAGFRPPTFNELYYLNYGTQNLKPERSTMLDFGMVVEPWQWCSIDVSAYTSTIRELIVSVPVSPVITSAQNVGSATSQGAELVLRVRSLDGRLVGQWSHTIQFMRDATSRSGLDGTLIPYAVPELASALMQWDVGSWFASAQWTYTGYRYALPGEQYEAMLRPFAITSLQAGLRIIGQGLRAQVMAQCDNLFDVSYQVVRGYPMPGRALRLIVSMEAR